MGQTRWSIVRRKTKKKMFVSKTMLYILRDAIIFAQPPSRDVELS